MDGASSYRGHRYPVEVISHRVWPYFRFPLGFREVEEPVLRRGVIVSCETARRWFLKAGQVRATGLRGRRIRPGDKRHLDEVFIRIDGGRKRLWWAVDQDGSVPGVLARDRRVPASLRRRRRS